MNLSRNKQLSSTRCTPLKNKRTMQFLQSEDTLNLSTILNDTSIFNDTSLRQGFDDISIIANNGNTGEKLSEAYFQIMQTSRPSDVLVTLERLAEVCCVALTSVQSWNRYTPQNYWLAEESNTWKLLNCLFTDSIMEHPPSVDSLLSEVILSQKTLVEAFIQSDPEVRLLQLLVGWLESTAAYQNEATKTSAPVIGNHIHWGNTLQQLLYGSSFFNKEKVSSMVTCMDPDAPRRQNKTIHSDDQQDDNDLCKRIFTEIRCGKFQDAVALCVSAGQSWRGAVLQGVRLLHYEQKEEMEGNLAISGNASRDLWKYCVLGLATNSSENSHYRATISVLCGHLPGSIPACQGNWEDLLWAHLKVQIETRIDKFLHEHHATVNACTTPPDVLELLQTDLNNEEMSLQQIFNAVKALMDGKRESTYQTCQRHLMLGHTRTIMQESIEWLENTEEKFIRFLAHLVLVLRQMGKDPQHDIGDKILEKYVTQLIDKLIDGSIECPELIAYYTSTVPVERQIILYANLMERVHKSDFRKGVVEAGITAGIDIAASARAAIKYAIMSVQQDYGNIDVTFSRTTAVEKDKDLISKVISTLEWLSLIPDQVIEALWLSNAMIRTFIFIGNTDAASACIVCFNQLFGSLTATVSSNVIEMREHLCLQAYLEALESFATWYRHLVSAEPKDVEPLPLEASFTDKVHYEQRCAQVEQLRTRWKNTVKSQSKHTKNLLYNILLLPGGWLKDENECSSQCFSTEEIQERGKQLETLRRLCIPEVLCLILKILQSTDDIENHKEALKLCDIIADEEKELYKVFNKGNLKEFLERIKESSLLLVEKDRDMFGYELDE